MSSLELSILSFIAAAGMILLVIGGAGAPWILGQAGIAAIFLCSASIVKALGK